MTHIGPMCHDFGIRGYGNPDKGIVICGIAPGRDEVKVGRPLVGPTGQLLNAILDAVGWKRDDCYCTNVVCWQNNEPTPDEVANCNDRLLMELADIQPHLVVALGKAPGLAFFGRDVSIRGAVMWHPNGYYVLNTYHPAAILRGGAKYTADIVRDLRKIALIKEWPRGGRIDVSYEVVDSVDRAQAILDGLPRDVPISMDTETDISDELWSEDVHDAKLLCISVCVAGTQHAKLFPAEVCKQVRWPQDVVWTTHNGLFDMQTIRNLLGVKLPIVEDTMMMSYALDSRGGLHRLKGLAREYVGVPKVNGQQKLFAYEDAMKPYAKTGFGSAPRHILHEYNCIDSVNTSELARTLPILMEEERVERLYRRLLLPALNAFTDITHRGIHVDQKWVTTLLLDWCPRWLEEEARLMRLATELGWSGPKEINFQSPKQLSKFLFEILRLPGGPSTNAKELEGLRNSHPFVDALLKLRRLNKMIKYIETVQSLRRRDGRVHPEPLIHGTINGRFSYHNPAVQTIPAETMVGDDFGRLRNIFGATNEDYVIIESDYSQLELWMAVSFSGDPQMLADLQDDFHTNTAMAVYQKPKHLVESGERYRTKRITFGIMYGRMPASLARGELNCSVAQAEEFYARWWARYPVYRKWWDATRAQAIDEGEIQTLTGRKRRFYSIGVNREEMIDLMAEAVNYPLQSVGHDVLLSSINEMHHGYDYWNDQPARAKLSDFDAHLLLELHDAAVTEASRRHLQQTLTFMSETMTRQRFEGVLPVQVKFAVGRNWGATETVTPDENGVWRFKDGKSAEAL